MFSSNLFEISKYSKSTMIEVSKMLHGLRKYYSTRKSQMLEIKTVRETDIHKAREFLGKHFYNQEPLHVSMKLHQQDKRAVTPFERYIKDAFKSEMSIMMLNQRKDIMGLCLSRIVNTNQVTANVPNRKFKRIAEMVDIVNQKCNLFEKFGVDNYVKLDVLLIDPTAERTGIEKKLVDVTRYLAQQNDIKLLRMDCTNHYNALQASRLGFTPIFKVKYENYRIGDKPVFTPALPHTEFAVFVQIVDEKTPSIHDRYFGNTLIRPVKEYL